MSRLVQSMMVLVVLVISHGVALGNQNHFASIYLGGKKSLDFYREWRASIWFDKNKQLLKMKYKVEGREVVVAMHPK